MKGIRRVGYLLMIAGLLPPVAALFVGRREKREVPVFQIVKAGEEDPGAQVIQFEETQLFMEFPASAGIQEIQKAVRARFPENKLLPGDPNPGRIHFEGWQMRTEAIFSFRYALFFGVLIFFCGFCLKLLVKLKSY